MLAKLKHYTTQYPKFVVWSLVAVLFACLVYMRFISHFIVRYPLVLNYPAQDSWLWWMYRGRYGIMLVVGATFLALAWHEFKTNAFSTWLLAFVTKNRVLTLVFLAVLTVLGRSYLVRPALIAIRRDGPAIVVNSWGYMLAFTQGVWFPQWNNYVGLGNPWGQFHFSLTYWLIGFFNFIFPPYLSINVFLIVCHIGMTVAIFFCARMLFKSQWIALFCAFIWASAMYHYVQFVGLAGYTQVFNWISIPIILMIYEGLAKKRWYLLPLLTLLIATQFWVHQIYGMWILVISISYGFVRLTKWLDWSSYGFWSWRLLLVHVIGFLGATNQIFPVLLEGHLVSISDFVGDTQSFTQFAFVMTFEDVFTMQAMQSGRYIANGAGYISTGLFVLSLIGSVALIVQRRWHYSMLVLWYWAAIVLSFGPAHIPNYDQLLASYLPGSNLIYSIKLVGRYVFLLDVFMTLLGGLGAVVVATQVSKRLPSVKVGSLVMLFASLLFIEGIGQSTRFDSMYPYDWEGMQPNKADLYDKISLTENNNQRVLDVDGDMLGMEPVMFAGLPGMTSHPEENLSNVVFFNTIREALAEDAASLETDPIRTMLYLLDVGHVIVEDRSIEDPHKHVHYKPLNIAAHSPATGSCALDNTIVANNLWENSQHYSVDVARNMLAALPTLHTANSRCTGASSTLQVDRYDITFDRVELALSASDPMYAQLSYSYYPFLNVFVDGEPVAYFETGMGLIGIELEAGAQEIVIEPYLNRMRILNLVLNATIALVLIVLTGYLYRKQSSNSAEVELH